MGSTERRAREDDRLRGWKEISQFLHTSARTAQRWERTLGLPVRRIETANGAIVYASRVEVQVWLQGVTGQAAVGEAANEWDGAEEPSTDNAQERTGVPADSPSAGASPPEEDAEETVRWFRVRTRRLLWLTGACTALCLLGLLLVKPGSPAQKEAAGGVLTPFAQRQGRAPARIEPGDALVLRLTLPAGNSYNVHVALGTVVTCVAANRTTLALSVEPASTGARLHLYEMPESSKGQDLTEIDVLTLAPGQNVTPTKTDRLISVEWLRTVRSRPVAPTPSDSL